jgi:hypothetical protein
MRIQSTYATPPHGLVLVLLYLVVLKLQYTIGGADKMTCTTSTVVERTPYMYSVERVWMVGLVRSRWSHTLTRLCKRK